MKLGCALGLTCASMTLFIGCEKSSAPAAPLAPASTNTFNPNRAQPKLPTTKLWLGAQELTAELATRPKEIMTGMMFRQTMEEHEAMLFIFTGAGHRSFWMKNVSLPLSCAYIDSDGVILNPRSETARGETRRVSLRQNPQSWKLGKAGSRNKIM